MKKDIIYIDVEDDITAVIGRVKDSTEKIVALVPPKRIGILQSAVNLRLLARAAEQSNKHLVLITGNDALMALAASAKIPVAKNLQSKPELAEISALDIDDGEDIIDGAQLPVGELARTIDTPATTAAMLAQPAIDDTIKNNAAESGSRATPPAPGEAPAKPRDKKGKKVPNFNSFRKKLVIAIVAAILLLAFLIWAIFFSAKATILITARTTDIAANAEVTMADSISTDASANTIKSITQKIKKDSSVTFDATGSKEVGEKSKGQIVFSNCETLTPQTIPSGTGVSANGQDYVTQESAEVPGGAGGFGGCASPGRSDPVTIVASEIGGGYNTSSGTTFNVAGKPNKSSGIYFNAEASSDINGGSKRKIKIVSSGDAAKASEKLAKQDADDMKNQLVKQFDKDTTIIDQSFKVSAGDADVSPAVGAEAKNGKATISSNVTYSMTGVSKVEVGQFLDGYLENELDGKKNQRIYDNGADKAGFADVSGNDAGFTATLTATAKSGPKIDDAQVKKESAGKKYGEIQSSIEAIDGIDDVDVKFSPFWVSSAPKDPTRVTIEFKLNGE